MRFGPWGADPRALEKNSAKAFRPFFLEFKFFGPPDRRIIPAAFSAWLMEEFRAFYV